MNTVFKTEKDASGSRLEPLDAEKGPHPAFPRGSGNKNGRIAPVLPHLRGYDFGSDDSGGDESSDAVLGKQIEMEADNAIQYRTCSWQKVCFFP
jgi:hypothetical protein